METSHRLLIAVNTEDAAQKAVDYVIDMLGPRDDFEIGLIHFVPPLKPDTFESEAERWAAQQELENEAAAFLVRCRARMLAAGFASEKVIIRKQVKDCPNLAECIIEEQQAQEYGTVVVGRQSLSHLEQFLLGSVSSNLVQLAEKCAIWVVA